MDTAYSLPDAPLLPVGSASTDEKLSQIDLSHHFSEIAKARKASGIKNLSKYMGPGVIVMAGGTPDEDYFPFEQISVLTNVPDKFALYGEQPSAFAWLWNLFGGAAKKTTQSISIPKYAAPGDLEAVQLATALQYGQANGLPLLSKFINEFVAKLYQPMNPANTTTLVHTGNTDGWNKCVNTFCNPGEGILCEEYTFPGAVGTAAPTNVKPVGIKMDSEGMRADDLEKVLSQWDEAARGGMKRPHLMYTIPVGQNPCGRSMGLARKKEIYAVCVKYDVIIVEDDPYYFLQVGEYTLKAQRGAPKVQGIKDGESDFIKNLTPSYVRCDYQGRVIRLDTFSKVFSPGSRLGFFTCNPQFAERLMRTSEGSTQAPSGFSQAIVTQVLAKQWGFSGYIRWLRGMRAQYTARRDTIVDLLFDNFDLREDLRAAAPSAWEGAKVFVAHKKGVKATEKYNGASSLFSVVPPVAGMFLWLQIHMYNHPAYPALLASGMSPTKASATLTLKVFRKLAENKVIFTPGWFFAADGIVPDEEENVEEHVRAAGMEGMEGCFRVAYSHADPPTMKKAMETFCSVIVNFFEN